VPYFVCVDADFEYEFDDEGAAHDAPPPAHVAAHEGIPALPAGSFASTLVPSTTPVQAPVPAPAAPVAPPAPVPPQAAASTVPAHAADAAVHTAPDGAVEMVDASSEEMHTGSAAAPVGAEQKATLSTDAKPTGDANDDLPDSETAGMKASHPGMVRGTPQNKFAKEVVKADIDAAKSVATNVATDGLAGPAAGTDAKGAATEAKATGRVIAEDAEALRRSAAALEQSLLKKGKEMAADVAKATENTAREARAIVAKIRQAENPLAQIMKAYPATALKCDTAARKIAGVFSKNGVKCTIVRLEDAGGAGFMKAANGDIVATTGYHDTVLANGRLFDSLTGPKGATPEEYVKLWHPATRSFMQVREIIQPK